LESCGRDLASFGSDALAQHLSGITITDVKIAVVAGTFVVVVGDSNGSPFYYCGIPFSSSFTQAQTGHGVVTTWIFKSNGVLAIAFPFGVPGPPFIYTTTNGTSWTTTNAEGVFIGLGESASDIAWSASQQLWLMLVSISAGQWRFMTSPDGVNWTNVGSTHSYAGHNIVDIEGVWGLLGCGVPTDDLGHLLDPLFPGRNHMVSNERGLPEQWGRLDLRCRSHSTMFVLSGVSAEHHQ
jgi:hypothetical protein